MDNKNANGGGRSIGSMERAFEMIELIKQEECSTIAEFSEQLNCSESTTYYYLKTLEQEGYIIRGKDRYRIGLRFLTIGGHAKRQHEVYQKVGREEIETLLDELSERTGEIAVLATEECGRCLILYISRQGEERSRDVHLGTEFPLHLTATGKAILSTYSKEKTFDIIEGIGLPSDQRSADDTDSNTAAIRDELQQIRTQGFAFNDQERVTGERGIAVPVKDEQNGKTAICSVGIIGSVDDIEKPTTDHKSRRFMQSNTRLIQQTAQTITNKLYV